MMNKIFLTAAMVALTSAITIRKSDLPHDAEVDKLDPVSRYVNDEDIVQLHDEVKLVQLNKSDLPHDAEVD